MVYAVTIDVHAHAVYQDLRARIFERTAGMLVHLA